MSISNILKLSFREHLEGEASHQLGHENFLLNWVDDTGDQKLWRKISLFEWYHSITQSILYKNELVNLVFAFQNYDIFLTSLPNARGKHLLLASQ